MKFQLQLPNEDEIMNAAKIAGGVVIGLIVIRVATTIKEKIHEKKQDKEIKKLKAQVDDQNSRLARLERG